MNNITLGNNNLSVPTYECLLWNGKQRNYCLIIPVINEGGRLKSLIARLNKLNLHNLVDFILVDGGSDDGSIDIKKLDAENFSAVLVKTGDGFLSSQLRCAYHFALEKGYDGLITIDGNNKDDPSYISQFIEKLNEGYDFVQGSRYIKGGSEVNTPLNRKLAIRYIHAPIMSAFSGFNWTDTTQGYRAYSRNLLLNKDISPFRSIFSSYELLAYLSYRAPKLGLKCTEVPTSRRYPRGEIPTKINTWSANLNVFVILIKACLGYYNPK